MTHRGFSGSVYTPRTHLPPVHARICRVSCLNIVEAFKYFVLCGKTFCVFGMSRFELYF